MSKYEEDWKVLREIQQGQMYLYHEYPRFKYQPEGLLNALSICIKYDLDISNIQIDNCGLSFAGVQPGYDVNLRKGYQIRLINPSTGYHFDNDEWYAVFTGNGCGRLNLLNNNIVYTDARCEDIWREFCDKVKSYNPVDFDYSNGKCVFLMKDGKLLYDNINDIIARARDAMADVAKERKVAELKRQLEELER